MTTPTTGVWTYPETAGIQGDLTGYKVEAIDGDIGKIDKASNEVGSACIVVDTGPWIFGKKVMIPAGIVRSVDACVRAFLGSVFGLVCFFVFRGGPPAGGGPAAFPASARGRRRGYRPGHGLHRAGALHAPRAEARSLRARSALQA